MELIHLVVSGRIEQFHKQSILEMPHGSRFTASAAMCSLWAATWLARSITRRFPRVKFFDGIFDVFSRRAVVSSSPIHEVSDPLRRRILLYCNDLFSNKRSSYGSDYRAEFWEQIHHLLQYRHGKTGFNPSANSRAEDAGLFLLSCGAPEFLDFVEYIFRVDCYFHVGLPGTQIVAEINDLFRASGTPYYLTSFVKETVKEVVGHPFGGPQERDVIKIVAYPTIVISESEVLHVQALAPTLELLKRPHFKTANVEFMEALEDYRNGDYGDCLTKCNSALESTLKIICDRKRWAYQQTDTAVPLIRIFLHNTSLDPYFESFLAIVPTLRNRISKAHGAGVAPRNPSQHVAQFAINATATAILLLAAEVGEQ